MDEEKLELMLNTVYSNQGNVPPQVINEYNQEIMSIQESQEGLIWCISNFQNFHSEPLILFSLNTIQNWIKLYWESLTEEIIGELKQILFLQSKLISNAFSLAQASTQFSLFERLYPEHWPSFWDDLLTLNSTIVLKFLHQFVNSIEDRQDIKMQMQIDDSEKNVVQFLISQLEQRNDEAFSILDPMLEWIDPEPILESSIISIIQEDLNNSLEYISNYSPDENNDEEYKQQFESNINKLECAIKFLIGIVSSAIAPSTLVDLLNQLDIINNMILICQNEKFEEIMSSASNLISACAQFFEETPDAPQYYQLCLLLLSNSTFDDEGIISFISNYTEQSGNEEIAQSSFQALSNRLSAYFTDNPTNLDEYASYLLKKINTILSHNEGLFDAYLTTFLDSSNLSSIDPLSLSAMFNILIDAIDDHMEIMKQNEVAEIFASPLIESIQPPYEDPVYYAVSSYMTFLDRIGNKFDPENPNNSPSISIFQAMFNSLLNNLALEYDLDSVFKKEKFIDITNAFINTPVFKFCIDVLSEHVFGLVGTGDFQIINIASKMLQKFETTERTEIFSSCMQLMVESIQNDEISNDRRKEIIQAMLYMIEKQNINNEENPEISQLIFPYMEKLLSVAATDGEIMSMFIQTLYKSFGSNGLSLLLSIINDGAISDMQGLAKACEITNEYVKNNTDKSWVNDCINKLFDTTAQMIQGVSDWTDISEETKEATTLLRHFFILITQSSNFLSDESISKLLSFTGEIFPVLFQMKEKAVIVNAVKYLSSLINQEMLEKNGDFLRSTLIDNFIPLTFQIFTDEQFQLESGNWRYTIYAVLEFHTILLKTFPEMTAEKISQIFGQFPSSSDNEQAMNAYIQELHQNNDENTTLFSQIKGVLEYIHSVLHGQEE